MTYRWIGPWPGRGPFSYLPPWQRPGWIFGRGLCWWLLGYPWALRWWIYPPHTPYSWGLWPPYWLLPY